LSEWENQKRRSSWEGKLAVDKKDWDKKPIFLNMATYLYPKKMELVFVFLQKKLFLVGVRCFRKYFHFKKEAGEISSC
jgi:hypothetical protein